MQKYLSIVLSILLVWNSSCDHDETRIQQVATESKIAITDLEHEPAVKELLSNVQGSSANGRISSIEITDTFFKYSEPDSGILNYTFRLPDDSPDYFENLVLSQYEDGFYGFIYRYIPDGPYIAGDSFKGTFQQYNLAGELIREFTLPAVQNSAAAGGRTQLMNQCVKSIEQTCTTIYEVETRTDYPCHCQYDHKTEVSTVCTFSFNRGWCDDMTGIPPAGGGGTYVGASDATPRSGGPGGSTGTTTPKPVKKNPVVVVPEYDDITYDKVKSPCLVMVIKKLVSKDLTNDINKAILKIFETNPKVNLIIEEDASLTVPGRTEVLNNNNPFNIKVRLNPTLENSSSEYVASVIYHEAMHAFLNANGYTPDKTQQHVEIAEKYIGWLSDALLEVFPSLSTKAANGLALRGLKDIIPGNPPYFMDLISKYQFASLEELISLTDTYRNGTKGSTCN